MILSILCNDLQENSKKQTQQFKKSICDLNISCVNLSILQNKLHSKCQDWLEKQPPLPLFQCQSCICIPVGAREDTTAALT